MDNLVRAGDGFETWNARHVVPRHTHRDAYVALVLTGGYEECGSRGRFRVGPGDVLVHQHFDGHLNRFRNRNTTILNLCASGMAAPIGRAVDPDAVARTADRDRAEAALLLSRSFVPGQMRPEDWPDLLAGALIADPDCLLEEWAEEHGLAAETLSRGFRKVFGVTPAAFRLESRTRRALEAIIADDVPLAQIAVCTGFADQAHMSRAVHALTGRPPRFWRRSIPFKTEAAKLH